MSLTGNQRTLLEKLFGPIQAPPEKTNYLSAAINEVKNRTGINQIRGATLAGSTGSGIPKHVSGVSAILSSASSGATSKVVITFRRDPTDTFFAGVTVYAKGYQGNQSLTQVGFGTDAPLTIVLNNTGESVSLVVQATGNGGSAPIGTAPSCGVRLAASVAGGFGTKTTTNVSTLDQLPDGTTYVRPASVNANHQVGTGGTSPVNASGASTAAGAILTQSGTTKTITVASFTIQYGFGQVTYNSGSVTPAAFGKFTVYFSDPKYAGGTVTYLATATAFSSVAADGLQAVGSITTSSSGGGTGGGGGGSGGICFSPNTKIKSDSPVTIEDITRGALVLTAAGTWKPVAEKVVRPYKGPMLDMGDGELVTPNHAFLVDQRWVPASDLGFKQIEYDGLVLNLVVETENASVAEIMSPRTEHSYTLANGHTVHNFLPC